MRICTPSVWEYTCMAIVECIVMYNRNDPRCLFNYLALFTAVHSTIGFLFVHSIVQQLPLVAMFETDFVSRIEKPGGAWGRG